MSLPKAYDYVMQQGMAEKAFADDYRYLSPIEKGILMQIYQGGSATLSQIQQELSLDTDVTKQFLFVLEACGYIKPVGEDYRIANYFFAQWLKSNQARLKEITSVVSDAAMQEIETQPVDEQIEEK
jgi:DNA-binding MarR family transcriptional regulator